MRVEDRLNLGWLLALGLLVGVLLGTGLPAAAQETIPVRAGDHSSFSRIVFDFETAPGYEARLEDGRLLIVFDEALAFDFGSLPGEPLDRLSDPAVVVAEGGRSVVALEAGTDGRVRHFLSGASVVVDLMDPADGAEQGEAVAEAEGGAVAESMEPEEASEAEPAETEMSAATQVNGEAEPAPSGEERVIVTARGMDDGSLRLDYPLSEATPAAVFTRADHLWVVFAGQHRIDHSQLDWRPGTDVSRRLGLYHGIEHPDATVLRYALRGEQHVSVDRDGARWQIHLRNGPSFPRRAIEPQRREGPGGLQLFISAERIGPRLSLDDPGAGDRLEIVPFGRPGRAMAEAAQFVEFKLLATGQGVVLDPRAEEVGLVRYANGVAVESGSESGLRLSSPSLQGDVVTEAPRRLIDFPGWQTGPGGETFVENEQALLARVARARPGERRTARWDLARFYLGHGFAAAAHGVLEAMADTDPQIAETPEWRAVDGVALLELGRAGEAASALSTDALDAETEVWLWRALAAEAVGRAEDALTYYNRGKHVLESHSEPFQARMRLAAARAALKRGSLDTAQREIAALQDMPLARERAVEVDLLSGRLAAARGDMATARARLRDAAAARDRRVSAHARFALTRLLLREGDIDRDEAIARLERLRYAWRGDAVELGVLRKLGDLYAEAGDYRKGLEAYRLAASAFPDSDRAQEITGRMSQVFADLFLAGAADDLSPVAALGLFYDFQELTPLGAEGDRMIRRLVDRLVDVDLLGRAADLLEHQVNYRLEGTGRASVAIRLAKIYLADDKPQQALETMRATRQETIPAEVLRERSLVEARALAELDRFEEALVLLEDDRSQAAQLLRADIHWKNRNWPALARIAAEIMGDRFERDEALDEQERIQLIRRALALSFMNRESALARLRQRYQPLIEDGAFEGIFNLVTSEDPLPEGELARIAGRLSDAERYRSFLSAYRDEFSLSSTEAPVPGAVGGAS